jgi:lipopolysaccharide/colanic/teichoic acid biosynthesis glycosyltransferase
MKDFLESSIGTDAAPAGVSSFRAGSHGATGTMIGRPATASFGRAKTIYRDWGKRALDVFFVVAGLPFVLPIVAICALLLWMEGGRPFYTQPRVGRGGRTFHIFKLRTMVQNADALLEMYLDRDPAMRAEWEATQKLKNDPRITRMGRFLRASSIDELPQIFNVLIGDMSLVGPRPMMPQQLPLYGDASAYCAVRPGITGIWQVSARNEDTFASRVGADREYNRHLSFSLDLRLLFRTVGVVMRRTGY